MTSRADRYAHDWLDRARFARTCTEQGEPWPAWSTGEVLAVAVILQSTQTLAAVGYTEVEALERLGSDIDPEDIDAAAQWFAELRAQL